MRAKKNTASLFDRIGRSTGERYPDAGVVPNLNEYSLRTLFTLQRAQQHTNPGAYAWPRALKREQHAQLLVFVHRR